MWKIAIALTGVISPRKPDTLLPRCFAYSAGKLMEPLAAYFSLSFTTLISCSVGQDTVSFTSSGR